MGSKDPSQLVYCPILRIQIFIRPTNDSLHLYLIWIHLDYIQSLCFDFSQCRVIIQNMRLIFCMVRPLLFSYAAHPADGCVWLRAPSKIRSISCPTYLQYRLS